MKGEETEAVYVYCVGASRALAPHAAEGVPVAIEEGAPVSLVESGELAAVVSRVPLADYGEGELESRLADATWTAVRALRHERVVEHFARRAAVVPLRFGTIYLRRESVAEMLERDAAPLASVLGRLEGREEWGVNVYVDRALLKETVVGVSARLREMAERAAAASPGQGYLLRKKIDALRDEETRAETKRVAAETEARLGRVSDDAARLRTLKGERDEPGEVAARLAFLVPREGFEEFRAEAERLAEEHVALGFRFELTGPWPPYNFVAGRAE
ncbi:MAG TPA: GvpL/GvpF family gas vesicle protein [Pyrinomonadaceae bacterium]|jgi:hypothetical protein|nr:GvpL/GvpF family gas vesicle protein [Pyrinomonadaceae bacterium]